MCLLFWASWRKELHCSSWAPASPGTWTWHQDVQMARSGGQCSLHPKKTQDIGHWDLAGGRDRPGLLIAGL